MDYSGMSGIPLIAREPTGAGVAAAVMQGGLPMDAAHADIHAYEAPWKALCDFALHSDLDKINMANNPHYGQLVSQVRRAGKGEKNNAHRVSSQILHRNTG